MKNTKVFLKNLLEIILLFLTALLIGIFSFILYTGLVPDFLFKLKPVLYSFEKEIDQGSEFNLILFVLIFIVITTAVWLLFKFGIRHILKNRFKFPLGMFVSASLIWMFFISFLFAINLFDSNQVDHSSLKTDLKKDYLSFKKNFEIFFSGLPLSTFIANYQPGNIPGPQSDWMEYLSHKRRIYEIDITENAEGLQLYRLFIAGKRDIIPLNQSKSLREFEVAYYIIPRMYLIENVFKAANGKWQDAVESILSQIDFLSEVETHCWSFRVAEYSNSAKGLSIFTLNYLLNQKNFPNYLYPLVYGRLTKLSLEECDLKNVFISEYLSCLEHNQKIDQEKDYFKAPYFDLKPTIFDKIFAKLFSMLYQKNRTDEYFLKHIKKIIEIQKIPPNKWPADGNDFFKWSCKKKLFWWLQNSGGKYFLFCNNPNVVLYYPFNYIRSEHGIIFCYYSVRAYLDLARITAEFHMKYDSRNSYEGNIKKLESYKITDPFSGSRYKYDEKRQILYGIGGNKKDDKGEDGYLDNQNSPYAGDIILLCKIPAK